MQALLYVLPSDPHTGLYSMVHMHGLGPGAGTGAGTGAGFGAAERGRVGDKGGQSVGYPARGGRIGRALLAA